MLLSYLKGISSFLASWIFSCSGQKGAEPSKVSQSCQVGMVPPFENKVQVPSPPQQGLASWRWWMRGESGGMLCYGKRKSRGKAPNWRSEVRAVMLEDSHVLWNSKFGAASGEKDKICQARHDQCLLLNSFGECSHGDLAALVDLSSRYVNFSRRGGCRAGCHSVQWMSGARKIRH